MNTNFQNVLKLGKACELVLEAAVLICASENVTVTRVQDETNYITMHHRSRLRNQRWVVV
jgi:hypothetical protein